MRKNLSVKSLEWPSSCPRGKRVHSKPTALLQYCIAHYGGDASDDTIYRWASEGGKWSEPFLFYEDAQHAAQGDYDDRVLSEIVGVDNNLRDVLLPFVEAWNLASTVLDGKPASLSDIEALAKHYLKGGSIHRAWRALAAREAGQP